MIETKRLQLVPISLEHATDLYELWTDFEAIKYTYSTLLTTRKECCDRINFFIEKNKEYEQIINFAILCDNKAVGICGSPPVDFNKGEYGFFYQICRSNWGNGFGHEAAEALLHYILTNLNVTCIYADAVLVNSASIKILTHLGFQETHIQPEGFTRNDMFLDLIHFKYIV